MNRLTDMPDASLWAGDILRLSDNYDLGPGSGPVDLMVYEPHDGGRGLGLMVVSGYKAGLTLSVFPAESLRPGQRSLETSWLLAHWNEWFCYTYERDNEGKLLPVPVEGAIVLTWNEREIIAKNK